MAGMDNKAKQLRRNPTEAEKLFWRRVRNSQLGCKFRRQVRIDRYIADFLCFELRLVVELDGGQHTPERDAKRTDYLKSQGFDVIRFWNGDVLGNMDGVIETLKDNLNERRKALS